MPHNVATPGPLTNTTTPEKVVPGPCTRSRRLKACLVVLSSDKSTAFVATLLQHDPALRPTAKDLHAQLLACPPADSHSSVSSPRLAPLKTNVRDGSGSELRKEVCISIASEGTNSSTEGRQRTVDSCSTGTQVGWEAVGKAWNGEGQRKTLVTQWGQ